MTFFFSFWKHHDQNTRDNSNLHLEKYEDLHILNKKSYHMYYIKEYVNLSWVYYNRGKVNFLLDNKDLLRH